VLKLIQLAFGFLVVCSKCGREFGKVHSRREAYCRAGEYIHDCNG